MKFTTKLISIALCGVAVFSCGCFGSTFTDPDRDYMLPKSEITVQISVGNGTNYDWLGEKIIDFEQYYAEDELHPEHKGVKVKVEKVDGVKTSTIYKEQANIFICENESGGFVQDLASNGYLVSLDDIVYQKNEYRYENGKMVEYSINDKILPEFKSLMQYDGVYYGIPTSGTRNGVYYDVTNFNEYGLYFADPSTATKDNSVVYDGALGRGVFINKDSQFVKSCGIDGVFGTEDDGLPSSLEELLLLCDYMENGVGQYVQPFTTYGNDPTMKEMLVKALWASLAGSQQYQTHYTFNGTVDTVTGVTDQNAFTGIDYIKQPSVKTREVYPRNGFYANNQVSRYWAISALRIISTEGWFSSITDPELSDREIASKFLMNGSGTEGQINPVCAMFIENDRWYNKLEDWGLIDEYENFYKGSRKLQLAWMPMPTLVKGTVQPNQDGKPNPYFEAQSLGGAMFINDASTLDAVTLNLCKKFIQYINTDDALSLYTATTGTFRTCMNYTVSNVHLAGIEEHKKSSIASFSKVTNKVAPVETEMYNPILFSYYDKGMFIGSLGSLINSKHLDAYDLFKKSCTSELKWNSIKKGLLNWYSPEPEELDEPPQNQDPSLT